MGSQYSTNPRQNYRTGTSKLAEVIDAVRSCQKSLDMRRMYDCCFLFWVFVIFPSSVHVISSLVIQNNKVDRPLRAKTSYRPFLSKIGFLHILLYFHANFYISKFQAYILISFYNID